MENYIISIIGLVFYMVRYHLLRPEKTISTITPKKTNQERIYAAYNMVLFFFFGWLWYIIPAWLQILACRSQLVATMWLCGWPDEDYFVSMFIILAPQKESFKIFQVYSFLRTLNMMVVCSMVVAVNDCHARTLHIAAAAVFCVALCFYRIIILGMIIKTKSVQFIPYIICWFMFLSPVLWFTFCLLQRDLIAAVPNAVALVLGAVQLITYAIYCDRDVQPKKLTAPEKEKGNGGSQVEHN